MNVYTYIRERMKFIVVGFTVGLLAGYARTLVFEPADLPESGRWILALQIAFAFSALGLFIANYLELRQRVIKRAETLGTGKPTTKDESKGEDKKAKRRADSRP
jgi:hypothetical protein